MNSWFIVLEGINNTTIDFPFWRATKSKRATTHTKHLRDQPPVGLRGMLP